MGVRKKKLTQEQMVEHLVSRLGHAQTTFELKLGHRLDRLESLVAKAFISNAELDDVKRAAREAAESNKRAEGVSREAVQILAALQGELTQMRKHEREREQQSWLAKVRPVRKSAALVRLVAAVSRVLPQLHAYLHLDDVEELREAYDAAKEEAQASL